MKIKESVTYKCFNYFNLLLMFVLMLITVYPLLYVLFASLSDATSLMMQDGLILYPLGFTGKAYGRVFENPMVLKGYLNTIKIVFLGTALNIALTILGAYILSRKTFAARNALMFFAVFTMFFSGGMIPTYLTVRGYSIDNTIWSLILPTLISTYNMIIMRTSFSAIPDSLEESAKLDGAGHLTILSRIVVPLSMPVIAVMVLYYSVAHWNSWFSAMLYIRDRDKFPLQLVLREILIQNDTSSMTQNVGNVEHGMVSETVKYATIMVSTLPILFVYPFLQKYFLKGMMIGAVKG